MTTHSSILAREIPWTEEPGGLQSKGSQIIRNDWVTQHGMYIYMNCFTVHLKLTQHCNSTILELKKVSPITALLPLSTSTLVLKLHTVYNYPEMDLNVPKLQAHIFNSFGMPSIWGRFLLLFLTRLLVYSFQSPILAQRRFFSFLNHWEGKVFFPWTLSSFLHTAFWTHQESFCTGASELQCIRTLPTVSSL